MTAQNAEPSRVRVGGEARRRLPSLQVLGVYFALAILWVVLANASPYFFTLDNVRNILIAASTVALIGAGFTVVLIAGEIDLAFAAMQAFTTALSAVIITKLHIYWPIGMLLAVFAATASALITGAISVAARLPTFITTLALLGIVQGAAFLMTEGEPISGFPQEYQAIGTSLLGPVPMSIGVVVVVYAVLYVLLNHTVFGTSIYAVGGNRTAAQLVGIRPGRVVIGVLGMSGFLAGLAGIIISARLNAGSGTYGANDLLPTVAGVIIGGTSLTGGKGSLLGTLGGVLITVTIGDGLVLLNVSEYWTQILVGIIILAAVLIDQTVRGNAVTGLAARLFRQARPSS